MGDSSVTEKKKWQRGVYMSSRHCAGIIGPKKEFFVSKSLEEFSPEWSINPLKSGFRPVHGLPLLMPADGLAYNALPCHLKFIVFMK